jgi:hypothetical protein
MPAQNQKASERRRPGFLRPPLEGRIKQNGSVAGAVFVLIVLRVLSGTLKTTSSSSEQPSSSQQLSLQPLNFLPYRSLRFRKIAV